MERPLPQDRVIIAGAGIAGLSAALRLAQEGIGATIIAPDIATLASDVLSPGTLRKSTPIIYRRTLQRIGLPREEYQETEMAQRRFRAYGAHDPISAVSLAWLRIIQNAEVVLNPLSLVDELGARRELYAQLRRFAAPQEGIPLVQFVQAKVTDVVMEGKRVTGVMHSGSTETLHSDLVIDATGRAAHIARRIQQHDQTAVSQVGLKQPGALLGAYMEMRPNIEEQFPARRAYLRLLPGEQGAVFGKIRQIPGSRATHGFFIEGDSQVILDAMQESRTPSATSNEQRLGALRRLVRGSDLETMIDQIASVETTVFFNHQTSQLRRLRGVTGAILIGDALLEVNPEYAGGFRHITSDISRLLRQIRRNGSWQKTSEKYNFRANIAGFRKLLQAEIYHYYVKLGHFLLGTNLPLATRISRLRKKSSNRK